ncbi:hypothetical protein I3760_14G115900 [Carya illinoinensis]|nr:hypothetical protein I3760_14G115900 [Carya illinoinensis]
MIVFWLGPFLCLSSELVNLQSCERAVAEAKEGSSDDFLQECILRLLSALVHSRRLKDLHRGIAILEASLARTNSSLPKRDRLYLLAVGYFRTVDFMLSRYFVDECLMIAPDWRQAQALKKEVEDRIKCNNQSYFPLFHYYFDLEHNKMLTCLPPCMV